MSAAQRVGDDRVLTFDIDGSAYALPIRGVVEVTQVDAVACVPSLPRQVGGVVNHHGDALPMIDPHTLLGVTGSEPLISEQAIVVTDQLDGSGCLALAVDRVVGLVTHAVSSPLPGKIVIERSAIGGRVTSVLDPKQLVARAQEIIERSVGSSPSAHGGDQ